MIRDLTIELLDGAPRDAQLLLPRPIDDWDTAFDRIDLADTDAISEIGSRNSGQRAYLLQPTDGKVPRIRYRFIDRPGQPPDWFWQVQDNRFTRAAEDLVAQAREISGQASGTTALIHRLIEHCAEVFEYGHVEQRFNDGSPRVPSLCGTARGSCVDMNTYILAAARSLGLEVQYLAGYWFHPQKTQTTDMHCWLVFRVDGEPLHWDLAHHIKWGIEPLVPGRNPAGGRRVPMSCGRGLIFATDFGEFEISHFSEPLWLLPDATTKQPQLKISLSEFEED